MIAYNKEWLNNILLQEELKEAFQQNKINKKACTDAMGLFSVGFYTPNIFIRIGLFLLTLIIIGFSFGLVLLPFFSGNIEKMLIFLCLFFSVLCYLILEYMVIKKNHYKSGVDDGLLLTSLSFFYGALLLSNFNTPLYTLVPIIILSFYFLLRFSYFGMGLILIYFLHEFIIILFNNHFGLSLLLTPILLLLFFGSIYIVSKHLAKNNKYKFYKNVLALIQLISLIIACVSINYYWVVTANKNDTYKNSIVVLKAYHILLWMLTIALPLLCIYFGIKKRDKILGRAGLLLSIATLFTIGQFYIFLPAEILMMLAGIILIPCTYYLIKKLEITTNGFTSNAIKSDNGLEKLQVESLILAETFSGSSQQNSTNLSFGGGSFGGGGASGDF